MEVFLSTILAIILGFYLFGILARFLLRTWITKKMREMEKQGGNANGNIFYRTWGTHGNFKGGFNFNDTQKKKAQKEGEVHIDRSHIDKKVNEQVGDYIEFEEIKEN